MRYAALTFLFIVTPVFASDFAWKITVTNLESGKKVVHTPATKKDFKFKLSGGYSCSFSKADISSKTEELESKTVSVANRTFKCIGEADTIEVVSECGHTYWKQHKTFTNSTSLSTVNASLSKIDIECSGNKKD